jgi:hypothetical protein
MNISQICRLSEEVKTGELLEAVFIDQAVRNPDSKEADREFVLQATYPTRPLRALVEHIAQKLSRMHPKGAVVVRGDYGSGKSHALLALYHLASAGAKARDWLERWRIQTRFPDQSRVALVQLVAEQPETLWELLFKRAGRPELNKEVRNYPTREQWAALASDAPTLFIIDELELWFGQLPNGPPKERTKAALQNLLEAANLPDVPLAVAISVYGRDLALMGIINRTQPPSWDVGTAEDRDKIVRHRLVKAIDEEKASAVISRYIEAYQEVRPELPLISSRLAELQKEMLETYPFHPSFLRQAFQVYAAAPHHESTRGIIFLGATLLRRYARKRDLLLTGDLDITDESVASDLRKLDPDLVANAHEDLLQRCQGIDYAGGIVGTILLHSFSPYRAAGASREDVLVGNFRPSININDLQGQVDVVFQEAWFIDEIEERFVITKEVVLLKRIEQQARALLETPEGRQRAAERIREALREFMAPETVFLYPEDPLPEALAGKGLRYVVSLEPLSEEDALEMLRGRGNTVILVVPKLSVRGRLTHDREMLLRAGRVLVCEDLLRRGTKRQSDVRRHKGRFEREFKQALKESYGRWMRISRTNELGEEPEYVVRAIGCALDPDAVRGVILQENDVEVVKGGIRKVLRYYGRSAPKGSEQAGRTVAQLQDELRRHTGLPILVQPGQLAEVLQSMVQDEHPSTGAIVSVGRALYGYDARPLPSLTDDCRVWLRAYAPEPPAPQDVKHAVRQALAESAAEGRTVQSIKGEVTSRLGVSSRDVLRALAELVNEMDAVLEQAEERFPDDEHLSSEAIADTAEVWLSPYAPPDDRQARERIMQLVMGAVPEGIALGELKTHLSLEGIEEAAIERGVKRLLLRREVEALMGEPETPTLIHDPSLLTDEVLIRLPIVGPPPPPPVEYWPFSLSVGPYRLLAQFLRDLEARLPEEVRIRSATFQVVPTEDAPDPLFGRDEELADLAEVTTQHQLICTFTHPSSKAAFLSVSRQLVGRLEQVSQVLLSIEVSGEVPRDGR